MPSPPGNSDSLLVYVWLTLFAASSLGLAVQLWAVFFQPNEKYVFSKARWFWYGTGILSLSLIGTDIIDRSSNLIANVPPLVAKSVSFSIVLVTSRIFFGAPASLRFLHDANRLRASRSRERWLAGFVLVAVAALAWYRFDELAKGKVDAWDLADIEALLEEVPEVAAQTDQGHRVKLHRVADRANGQLLTSIPAAFAEHLIRNSPPDKNCNCHGWVFTDGQYVVRSRDVPIVLMENGYQEVRGDPRPNDLVVYHSPLGGVVHTGIVRVADANLVLVESKWGFHGRYLHRVDDQYYSNKHSFYRTSRPTHAIKLVSGVQSTAQDAGPRTRIVAQAQTGGAAPTVEK